MREHIRDRLFRLLFVKPFIMSNWLIALALSSRSFRSMKRFACYSHLDGMLVHHRLLLSIWLSCPNQLAHARLYAWVGRGTVRVKCLSEEHNTMTCSARALTWTARCGIQHTNHQLITSLIFLTKVFVKKTKKINKQMKFCQDISTAFVSLALDMN